MEVTDEDLVPGMPGAHTQGATLDELQKNLKEVLELCIEGRSGDGHAQTSRARD